MGPFGRIRVLDGQSAGAVHDLRAGRNALGRDPAAAIHLPDPTVSKDQALLECGAAGVVLVCRSPRNPPLVNGETVLDSRPLRDGDELLAGSVRLAYEAPPAPRPRAAAAPRGRPAAEEDAPPAGGAHGTRMLRRPWLVVSFPGGVAKEESLYADVLTLGRAPECEVRVDFPTVSGRHAKFALKGGRFTVEDLDSTNGTSVNGKLLDGPHELADGDILRIGDLSGNSVSLTYREEGAELRDALSTVAVRRLQVEGKDSFVLGRDPACDVALDASLVSWRHARVDRTEGGHSVTDLNSTNGTFVNGQRVTGRRALRAADIIHIGPYKFVYTAAGFSQSSSAGRVRVDGMKIRRTVGRGRTSRVLLNDISLTIQPREFVCFVGGSGAGKSTLMKAFAGIFHVDGRILVNGEDLLENYDAWKGMLGYVPQDDIVHGDLTVDHAIRYAARLRLPKDTRKAEIDRAVDRVLGDVEMVPHRDKLIRSLSGGQRKRVSIAVEMLSEPSLFFLDEPTSGLDPGLEKKMMYMMRRLADGGRTILMVTHATANITQCDHVAFLARGRLVWYGPPAEALDHFGVRDFSDIYTEIEKDPEGLERKYRASRAYQKWIVDRQKAVSGKGEDSAAARAAKAPVLEKRTAGSFRQFLILTRRYSELVFRDRLLLLILLAVMPAIGMMLAAIAERHHLTGLDPAAVQARLDGSPDEVPNYQVVLDAQKLLFMTALAVVLLGLFGAAYEVVKERPVYRRERMVNLRIGPYLLSKVFVLFGFALVQCAALLGALLLRLKFPEQGILMPALAETYVTLVLTALAAILLGLFVSTVAPNSATVIYVVLMVVFSQILFTGVIFDLREAKPVSYAMPTRWAVEALGSTVDMEALNGQSRTKLQFREPVKVTVPVEVTKPIRAEDLGPSVGKLLKDAGMEDQLRPLEIKETREESIRPDPVVRETRADLPLKYLHDRNHLVFLWCGLAGFAAVFALLTCLVLWWKDRQEG